MAVANGITKICSKCRIEQHVSSFGAQNHRSDGLNPWCRACKSKSNSEHHAKNRDKRAAQAKAWAQANPEKVRDRAKRYRENSPEAAKAANDRYRKANPEKRLEWSMRDYWKNRSVRLTAMREYRAANQDVLRSKRMVWERANRPLIAMHKRAYKARKRCAEGRFTPHDVERLKSLQRGRCACCKGKLFDFHIDHRTALSKGGTNDPSNLQLLCPKCNLTKHAKDPIDFMQSLGFLL
jgi:5-methylcytosine-specific restriction endonuclease McrA